MGPLLQVNVHVPTALATILTSNGQTVPAPITGFALIDTGATNTCVDDSVIQRLGVSTIGVSTALTAAGPTPQNMYPARLEFPGESLDVEFNSVAGVNLQGQLVPILAPGTQARQQVPIIVLVGRDVLARCVLTYNGVGGFISLHV